MKKEDRIISSLFEEARQEAPKVSFEQMAQHLGQQAPVPPAEPTSLSSAVKQLLLKNIGLNSIILVVGAGLVYYGLTPSTSTPETSALSQVEVAEDSLPSASPILPIAQPLIQTQKAALPSPSLLSDTELKQKRKFKPLTPNLMATPATSSDSDSSTIVITNPVEDNLPSTQSGPVGPSMDSIPSGKTPANSPDPLIQDGTQKGPNPPAVAQPSDSLLMSGFTIQDKIKIDTTDIYRTTPIILKNSYNQDATNEFFTLLSSYGFNLKKKKHRFKDGLVRNISIHLTHKEGLDFKLKAVRFKQLEFKLYFDESDQLYGFSVRMNNNQEKKEKIISLKAKGHITQQYRY